jgi:hypothetical protein
MDLERFRSKIILIQGQQVIIDTDVGELYGVETKRVNEAIRNNPEKFPKGYIIVLTDKGKAEVVENFDHLSKQKFSPAPIKALTERSIYYVGYDTQKSGSNGNYIGDNRDFCKSQGTFTHNRRVAQA